MSAPLEKVGGRKFVICMTAMGVVPVLAGFHAPVEAYLAVTAVPGFFVGGNAMVTRKALETGKPDA